VVCRKRKSDCQSAVVGWALAHEKKLRKNRKKNNDFFMYA
jgi:hypothetical protein